jgi:hypothetical protein
VKGPPRPAPVLRFLHRPLWWAFGVLVFVLLQFGVHAFEVHADASTFADVVVVRAEAAPANEDTGLIDLTYRDGDGRPIPIAILGRAFVDRSVVGPVDVEVSVVDPRAARFVTDRRGYFDEMPYLLVLLVVPLASLLLRWLHIRRLERLVAAEDVSYAMLAAVAAPDLLHPRWRLCLYPLDARAGALPVCAVELVWLPVLPHGAFPVDVKGDPRPFGSIAVRTEAEVLWPRGRVLAATARQPRPADVLAFPAGRQDPPSSTVPRRPSLWPARALRLAFLAALAAYVWIGSATAWRNEQALEHSRPAVATVVALGDGQPVGLDVTVRYERDGERVTATLHPQGGAPAVGDQIPIRADNDDRSLVWEASLTGPPDARLDTMIIFILVAMVGTFTASVLTRRQALEELGVYELATAGRVDMGTLPPPS